VFENTINVDPLNDEYKKIVPLIGDYRTSTVDIKDASIDYIVCVNVIDHTIDSDAMVRDIIRMLKDGGRLYFGVNFDDSLSLIHYELWNKERVNIPLTLLHKEEERVSEYNQTKFWAV
jgi:SAM-dependent methyltransferase